MLIEKPLGLVAHFTLPYWSLSGFQGTCWHGLHWTHPDMLRFIAAQLAVAAALAALAALRFRKRYPTG